MSETGTIETTPAPDPTTTQPTITTSSTSSSTTATTSSTSSTTTYTSSSTSSTTLEVPKSVELIYDDDSQDGKQSLGSGDPFSENNNGGIWGHTVHFFTGSPSFEIEKIEVYGKRYGESRIFRVEVRDKNKTILYSKQFSPSEYFSNDFQWAVIDIPNVLVAGDFYVGVFTNSMNPNVQPTSGIDIGYDNTVSAGRSYTVRDGFSLEPESLNWMIRIVGKKESRLIEPLKFSINVDGVIDDWSGEYSYDDRLGDSIAKDKVGTDIEALYAKCDGSNFFFALKLNGSLNLSKFRNYFLLLDFNWDQDLDYVFGFRPDGTTWKFFQGEPVDIDLASSLKNGIMEGKIQRYDYNIPENFQVFARVTEGGPVVDYAGWLSVSC